MKVIPLSSFSQQNNQEILDSKSLSKCDHTLKMINKAFKTSRTKLRVVHKRLPILPRTQVH